jgi:prophage regulatory protein
MMTPARSTAPTKPSNSSSRTAPPCLLRRPDVERRTGYSRSSIYAMMEAGDFPRPVKLGPRAVAWVESEVDAWISARIEARDGAGAAGRGNSPRAL